jgi:uncharacterized protein (TIGR03000 family)
MPGRSVMICAAAGVLAAALAPAQDNATKIATIKLLVPTAAKVTVDGQATSSIGDTRVYETPPLASGRTFTYELKATWEEGGYQFVRRAEARVQAGKETVIDLRQNSKDGSSSQIVYVPTPDNVVAKMLEMAKVTKEDVVFDLGCGDGRIVVMAASKIGAHGVGIDLDPERVKEAQANVDKAKVQGLVEIRKGDALKVEDLGQATVVMLYMLPEFMKQLKPIVLKECKPGTRIVAHDYPFPEWPPRDTVRVETPGRPGPHTLFLWVIEKK